MNIFKAFSLVTILSVGSLVAGDINPLEIYDILGVDYSVEDNQVKEGARGMVAAYYVREDKIRISAQEKDETDAHYLATVIHELVHYTGSRKDRVFRPPYIDVINEEFIAEYTTVLLSKVLYKGEHAYPKQEMITYLLGHSKWHELTEREKLESYYYIREAYNYLIHQIKKLDIENRLMLQ